VLIRFPLYLKNVEEQRFDVGRSLLNLNIEQVCMCVYTFVCMCVCVCAFFIAHFTSSSLLL